MIIQYSLARGLNLATSAFSADGSEQAHVL
jgi:hypothetical protein